MFISIQDPHIGRCLNLRMYISSYGGVEYLRCLDYEATQHVCFFPKPKTPGTTEFTNYQAKPAKWVRPDAYDVYS